MFKHTKKTAIIILVAAAAAATITWSAPAFASEPFIGQIQMFGFNFAPRGWTTCDGQLLPISQYQALFSLLGTIYGGDGRTTFGLPDLRGRVAIHMGQGAGLSNRPIGSRGGSETVTLTVGQIPSHNHIATAHATDERGNAETPGGNVWAKKARDDDYSTDPPAVTMNAAAVTIGNTGSSQSHENMPPFLTVNFSIALVGLYPSRN
jgi:microcystin-dependent protein